MEASRDTLAERRAIECCADTLLVHGVPGLVQRREQRVAKVVLVDARGDANVTSGKPTAERMVSEVEPAALEIVAETLRNVQRKVKLGRFGESLPWPQRSPAQAYFPETPRRPRLRSSPRNSPCR